MAEPFTVYAGTRHAFAPSADPIDGVVHRIQMVLQASDGRIWEARTDMVGALTRQHRRLSRPTQRLPGVDHEWTYPDLVERLSLYDGHFGL